MDAKETKPFWLSKTVLGAAMVLAGVTAQSLGFDFGADLQAKTVDTMWLAVEAVGGLAAIYGRVVATKKITGG